MCHCAHAEDEEFAVLILPAAIVISIVPDPFIVLCQKSSSPYWGQTYRQEIFMWWKMW